MPPYERYGILRAPTSLAKLIFHVHYLLAPRLIRNGADRIVVFLFCELIASSCPVIGRDGKIGANRGRERFLDVQFISFNHYSHAYFRLWCKSSGMAQGRARVYRLGPFAQSIELQICPRVFWIVEELPSSSLIRACRCG